jgi:hypothetical protein
MTSDSPSGHVFLPAVLALLTGGVLGWVGPPACDAVSTTMGGCAGTDSMIAAGFLLALSFGPQLPRWLSGLLRRRRGEAGGKPTTIGEQDVQLLWVTLAVVAFVAGIGIALTPVFVAVAERLHRVATESFLWMPRPHMVLVAAVTTVSFTIPMALTGAAMACVDRVGCITHPSRTSVLAWCLLGAGSGAALETVTVGGRVPSEIVACAASVGLFVVAMAAICHANRRHTVAPTPPANPHRGRRIATVAVVFGAVLAFQSIAESSSASHASLTLVLWAMAVGLAIGASETCSRFTLLRARQAPIAAVSLTAIVASNYFSFGSGVTVAVALPILTAVCFRAIMHKNPAGGSRTHVLASLPRWTACALFVVGIVQGT